jgi:MSHA biogenesis protein MshI
MLSFLRRRKDSQTTAGSSAVCLYPGRIDVARITAVTDGLPRVLALESWERHKNDTESLKRLANRYKLLGGPCTSLLGTSDYQLIQMDASSVTGDTPLREGLAEKLSEQLDQPLANFTYDMVRIPTENFAPGRAASAYAVVAGNAVIAPRVQLFHQAHLNLTAIDIPEMAQRNIAALCETRDRALAFLSFDQHEGLLSFTCNGELYMSRRVEIGLAQLLTDDLERRSSLFDRIGLEVQRSLDNFDRQFGFLPLSRLLLGPQPEAQALQGFLRDYLAITVDVLDLRDVLDTALIPELKDAGRQAQCLFTLGAALRGIAGNPVGQIAEQAAGQKVA